MINFKIEAQKKSFNSIETLLLWLSNFWLVHQRWNPNNLLKIIVFQFYE